MGKVQHRAVTLLLFLLISGCAAHAAPRAASPTDTYCNPLDVLLADPFIYHEKGTYYLYGTSAGDGLLVWTSDDLVHWRSRGHAFRRTDSTWSREHFWAPEMFAHNGKYYLHFTAVGGPSRIRRIVLAEADSPLGPFKEIKAPWFDATRQTIDSHVFRDEDGKLYLYAVALFEPKVSRVFEIYVRRLDDQLNPEATATKCIEADQKWEGVVNEGPFVVKHNGTYFLTYSAVGYTSPDYCVGIATSKSPLGPWTKAPDPILHHTPGVSGPGHHCFTESPDGKEMFIAYHTHQFPEHPGGPRQLAIDRAYFVDGEKPTIKVNGPTDTPQPLPSGAPPLVRGQSDEFNKSFLDRNRWTIFGEAPRFWTLKDGRLQITTTDGDVHEERSDLNNLFLEQAPAGDFTVTTSVSFEPKKDFDHAAILVWQNHNEYLKLDVVYSDGLKYEVAAEHEAHFTHELFDASPGREYFFRVHKGGDNYAFSVSTDGSHWKMLKTLEAKLLNLRVGIGAASPVSGDKITAEFDYVRFSK